MDGSINAQRRGEEAGVTAVGRKCMGNGGREEGEAGATPVRRGAGATAATQREREGQARSMGEAGATGHDGCATRGCDGRGRAWYVGARQTGSGRSDENGHG